MKISVEATLKENYSVKNEYSSIDITGPCDMEITTRQDKKVVWICIVDEETRQMFNIRVCRISNLTNNYKEIDLTAPEGSATV